MNISNTQFSLLEASEDFMATLLMLVSGIITDRVGGAGKLHLLKGFHTAGSLHILCRNDRLRKCRLHHRFNSCRRGHNSTFVQFYDRG